MPQIKHPWRDILKKDYRPEFTIAFGMPFLQQLTGASHTCQAAWPQAQLGSLLSDAGALTHPPIVCPPPSLVCS